VAGATSPVPVAARFCLCLLLGCDFSDNLVDEVFRGGGGGIEDVDEGKGSGDTESEEFSLCEPLAFKFRCVIEFRFRFKARATGE
jgi:hypothetical protein